MKLLLLTFFVIQTLALPPQPSDPVPDFHILEDRSENGSPSVQITFPNGKSDKLVLKKYYTNEAEERAELEHCNFIGHLEHEQDACIAMTGCPGTEDVEFTIMSKNSPESSFLWKKSGEVQVLKNELEGIYIKPEVDDQAQEGQDEHFKEVEDEIINENQEEIEAEIEENFWCSWYPSAWGCASRPKPNPRPQPKPDQKTHVWDYKVLINYFDNKQK